MTTQLLYLPLNTEIKSTQRLSTLNLTIQIVTNTELLQELKQYLEEQMTQTANMSPHIKLEFAKMTIRTKAIEINMRLRKKKTLSSEISTTK